MSAHLLLLFPLRGMGKAMGAVSYLFRGHDLNGELWSCVPCNSLEVMFVESGRRGWPNLDYLGHIEWLARERGP